jgi:hypothetical protein
VTLEKNPTTGLVLEFFGPTLEFLTLPKDDEHNDFCMLKGTIPPTSMFRITVTSTRRTFSSSRVRSSV